MSLDPLAEKKPNPAQPGDYFDAQSGLIRYVFGYMKTDTLQVTHELLALISEIDEFKGAWRALGTLAPDRLRRFQWPLATRMSDQGFPGAICRVFCQPGVGVRFGTDSTMAPSWPT